MSLASIKAWYLVHKWTSLVCMAFLLLLCVTGLPLIFHHEIDHALGYSVHPPEVEAEIGDASLDAMIADAAARRPDEAVQFIVRDPDEPEVVFVRLGETIDSPDVSSFFTYDARTAALLNDYPVGQGIMEVMFRLHYDMYTGLPGTLFLGFMGVVFLASLVSGAVLYAPYMRKLRFGTVRRRRAARVAWLDVHNLLGIATMVWLFVVGATGAINTLAVPVFGHWQSTQLAEMTAAHSRGTPPTEPGSAERALDAARAAEPDMQLSFMAFPGNPFASPHHYVAFMQGTTAWTSKLLKPVMVDAQTAEVVATRDLPWYVSAVLLSQPLHFGDYGGLPLKVLWAALDILAIVVLGSGIYLWLKRRNVSFEAWLTALQRERPEAVLGHGGAQRRSSTP